MALDPRYQALFDEMDGNPQGAPRALHPRYQSLFDEMDAESQRSAPPPVVIQRPAPQPTAPVQPVQAPAAPPEPSLLEKAAPYALKPLTAIFDPGNYALNKGAEAGLAAEREGGFWAGVVGTVRGTVEAIPEAFTKGLVGPPVTPTWAYQPVKAELAHLNIDLPDINLPLPFTNQRLRIEGNEALANTAQFIASWYADPAMARLGGAMLGFVAKTPAAKRLVDQALDIPVGKLGTGRQAQAYYAAKRLVKQYKTGAAATGELLKREGAETAKKLDAIWQKGYTDKGIVLERAHPAGGRSNIADEFTTDWLEAGWKGARFKSRAEVERVALAQQIRPEDLRKAALLVRATYRKSGRYLERVGYLKPGIVDKFGDQYAAAVYRFASKNPDDIAAALEAATKNGWISEDALNLAHDVMNPNKATGYQPGRSRTVEDPALAAKLGREYQATPAMAQALPKQAAVGAKFEMLDTISKNPELFVPVKRAEEVAGKYSPEAAQSIAESAGKMGEGADAAKQALGEFEAGIKQRLQARHDEAVNALFRYESEVGAKGGLKRLPSKQRTTVAANMKRLRAQAKESNPSLVSTEAALQRLYRPADRAPLVAEWNRLKKAARNAGTDARRGEVVADKALRQSGPREVRVPNERPDPSWELRKIGNHEGYWHPAALSVIDSGQTLGNLSQNKAWRALDGTLAYLSAPIRRIWAGFNPVVQGGNVKSNIALSQGAMASRGLKWSYKKVAEDVPALISAKKNPRSDPFYEALARRSKAFSGDSGLLGDLGSSLQNNVGIARTRDKALDTAKFAGWEVGPKAFGYVEELFKYSLFKQLVKGGTTEDEAAALVDRALFDHSDVNTAVYVANRWGLIPFATTRVKALENAVAIAGKNPEILLRHSGLRASDALMRAAGPEAEDRGQFTKMGQPRFYIPGVKDSRGQPASVAGQIFSQNPFNLARFGPLDPEMWNPLGGGVFRPLADVLRNKDEQKFEATGELQIVPDGSLPPVEKAMELAAKLWDSYAPVLWPGGRGFDRAEDAMLGRSRYGGRNSEPESPMEALLGVIAGVRVDNSETGREKLFRGIRNRQERSANQQFLAEYMSEARQGKVTRRTWNYGLPTDRQTSNEAMKNASSNLWYYLTGAQAKPGSEEFQSRVRLLADWLMQLQDNHRKITGADLRLEEVMAARRTAEGPRE